MKREKALEEAQHVVQLINAWMQCVPFPSNVLHGATVSELDRLGGTVAPHSFYYIATMKTSSTDPISLNFIFEPDDDRVDLANSYTFRPDELYPEQAPASQEGGAK